MTKIVTLPLGAAIGGHTQGENCSHTYVYNNGGFVEY